MAIKKPGFEWGNFQCGEKDLEERIGKILRHKKMAEGVYEVKSRQVGELIGDNYIIIHEKSPVISKRVKSLGEIIKDVRVYDFDEFSGTLRVIQYEIYRNMIRRGEPLPEGENLNDFAYYAAENQPDYFGEYPAPEYTPYGYSVRYLKFLNGVFWIETETGEELLAVCALIAENDLSKYAYQLKEDVSDAALSKCRYAFFSKQNSCVPLYEIMEEHKDFKSDMIRKDCLMSAVFKHSPAYAVASNIAKQIDFQNFARITGVDLGCELSETLCLNPEVDDNYFAWDD